MDPPVKKKKRDPPKNLENQRRYRARKNAAVDGIEEVRARGRQRYYERIARLKDRERIRGLQTAQMQGGTAALPHHANGATGGSQRQELDSAKGLEGENGLGGNVRGISTTPECTTATTTGGEKTNHGNQGMERASEDSLCDACRVRATQKVELVRRASGLSLSPAVVAAALGGVQA